MLPGEYQCPTYVIRYSMRKNLKLINLGNNMIVTLKNSPARSIIKAQESTYLNLF